MKNDCPSCGQPLNGRAFGMESYLKYLFQDEMAGKNIEEGKGKLGSMPAGGAAPAAAAAPAAGGAAPAAAAKVEEEEEEEDDDMGFGLFD